MSILHICNTHFEWELAGQLPSSLEKAFSLHPIFLQLQFLPIVYALEGDGLAVTAFPPENLPFPLHLFKQSPLRGYEKISTWGYSQLVKQWADKQGIPYEMPPWDLVKMVNSKSYSFAKSPLPGAKLLFEKEKVEPHFVLKSCFGTAGQGMILAKEPKADLFCEQQWKRGLPVIAEPWVERVVDFSTQWEIKKESGIIFLGTTFCKTTSAGVHQSNTVGDLQKETEYAPFIERQKEIAYFILKEMNEMGYFGEVGFDAMIYLDRGEKILQPVVEINARKTMGWVALELQRQHFPQQMIELSFIPSLEKGLLPIQLGNVQFVKRLLCTKIGNK